jgi:hypothetical protein
VTALAQTNGVVATPPAPVADNPLAMLGHARPGVEFRQCPGRPGIAVGDDGSVWSAWKLAYTPGVSGAKGVISDQWVEKKQRPHSRSNHPQVTISSRPVYVHRLVLETFVGPCPEGMECRHLDDNPTNNQRSNLAWGTRLQNITDRFRNGKGNAGERHWNARLKSADVLAIRAEFAAGKSKTTIAAERGIFDGTVDDIVQLRKWRHLASTEQNS